jgi:proline iminopeptidase
VRPVAAMLLLGAAAWCACTEPAPVPVRDGVVTLADGTKLHYRSVGQGRDTALVLHGGPALTMRYLVTPLSPLARHRTLLFYDQRGRGLSSPFTGETTGAFEADLADLDAVRRHFKLGRVTLVGHHYGAALAALYAHRHPGTVSRLLLVSPIYPRRNYLYDLSRVPVDSAAQAAFWTALAAGDDQRDPHSFCQRFWGFQFTPAAVTASAVVERLAPDMCVDSSRGFREREAMTQAVFRSMAEGWDWRDTLRRLQVPALVIQGTGRLPPWGSDSATEYILRHAAETWAAFLPQSRMVLFAGAPWFPWLGAERRFTAVADRFLSGEWPAEGRRVSTPPPTPTPLGLRPATEAAASPRRRNRCSDSRASRRASPRRPFSLPSIRKPHSPRSPRPLPPPLPRFRRRGVGGSRAASWIRKPGARWFPRG